MKRKFVIKMIGIPLIILMITAVGFLEFSYFREQSTNIPAAEALIQKVTHNNVTILSHFPAIANVEGFVVTTKPPSDKKGILYVDNQGRYLINDTVLDADGHDITQANYVKYVKPSINPAKPISPTETAFIQQGSSQASHQIYIVVDPNCIFCHQAFNALQPFILSGKLSVRWIVVGIIKPDSPARALSILSAKKPLDALIQNERDFNEATEEGGLPIIPATSEAAQKLAINRAFMEDQKLLETPVFFYKDTQNQWQMVMGIPNSFDSLIKQSTSF